MWGVLPYVIDGYDLIVDPIVIYKLYARKKLYNIYIIKEKIERLEYFFKKIVFF